MERVRCVISSTVCMRKLYSGVRSGLDIFMPVSCAGCGRGGTRLCATCREIWRGIPSRITTRIDTYSPVWSLGAYGGPRRNTIIAFKERGRGDMAAEIGAVVAAAVSYLIARGNIDENVVLVPAPTKKLSARLRGGDPVTRACVASQYPVWPCLRQQSKMKDSVGLDAHARRVNLSGRVDFLKESRIIFPGREQKSLSCPRNILLVDDIVTTGATLAASASVLISAGYTVHGALAWCHA